MSRTDDSLKKEIRELKEALESTEKDLLYFQGEAMKYSSLFYMSAGKSSGFYDLDDDEVSNE